MPRRFTPRAKRVLIIVQNLPVPLDRRVWMECLALVRAGVQVSVICPKGPDDPWRQHLEGVWIYKYAPPAPARGLVGYAVEFIYCWIMTALLSVVVAVQRGFDAIQACNPPDTYWALALLWRPFGKRFVYDQHDLNPEVFLSRFGSPTGISGRVQLRMLRWLESMTYRTADHVISTNESYKQVALARGRRPPESVTVVRSGPDTTTMRPLEPIAELRDNHNYLAVYLGIMGPQDGVDLALRAFATLVHDFGRTDCHFALLGFGDCLEDLRALSLELDLEKHVTFTGRVGPAEIADYLSSADIGICPDPKTPLNDVSTMNKTLEYMAYCLPIVSFDLAETRISADETAVYIPSGDLAAFAAAWNAMLDDPDDRVRRGLFGRERVSGNFTWAEQAKAYVGVWRDVLGLAADPEPAAIGGVGAEVARTDARGRRYVELAASHELADYIRTRSVR